MKNVPKTIYLHVDSENNTTDDFNDLDHEHVYWSGHRNCIEDIQYRLAERVFYVDEIRKMINQLDKEEISMSRFVEMLNEKATGLSAVELYKIVKHE